MTNARAVTPSGQEPSTDMAPLVELDPPWMLAHQIRKENPGIPEYVVQARVRGIMDQWELAWYRWNRSLKVVCPDCGRNHRRLWGTKEAIATAKLKNLVASLSGEPETHSPELPCPECAYQRHLLRKRVKNVASRTCDHCSQDYKPTRRSSRFCSTKCRVASNRPANATAKDWRAIR